MSKLDVAACLAAFDVAAANKKNRAESTTQCAEDVCAAVVLALPEALAKWAAQPEQSSRVFVKADTDKLSQCSDEWAQALEQALRAATGMDWAVDSTFVSADAPTLETAIRRMAREATEQEEGP